MNLQRWSLIILVTLFLALPLAGCSKKNSEQPAPSPANNNMNQGKAPSSPANQEATRQKQADRMLTEIEKLGREGKVPGCEFGAKTSTLEDVQQAWGQPDKSEYIPAAKGTFITFSKQGIVLGYNKGMQVFDIRSYDKALKVIRASDLTRVYGKAAVTRSLTDQQMVGYVVSDEFRLRFVFPAITEQNPDPGLDHLSVLYPAGSVNSMADDPGIQW